MSKYKLIFTEDAEKQFKKISKTYHSSLAKSLDRLKINPYLGKPLRKELKGYFRIRFSRFRIIYQIKNKKLIVSIVAIGHRREIYQKFLS